VRGSEFRLQAVGRQNGIAACALAELLRLCDNSAVMFSLQSLFGQGDRFHGLLEASAQEAQESVRLLIGLLRGSSVTRSLDELVLTRRKEKRIAEEISTGLVQTFVTGLEREDIESLSRALYKIPKSVEKFAERFNTAASLLQGVDFICQAEMLSRATVEVSALVKQLRELRQLEKVKELNDRLQYVEGEADKLMVALLRDLYSGRHDPLKVLVVKDLYELMEKAIDRCRDAGNIALQIALKNS
jgi:hypothetical protein